MPVETDTSSAKFAEYADPGRLVTGQWLEARLGEPGLVVVESDEDVLLYETGQSRLAHRAERPHRARLCGRRGLRRAAERERHLARRHRRDLRRQEQLV